MALSHALHFESLTQLQDSAVVQDPAGDGQIVYLFLPLYKARHSCTSLAHY